MRHERWMMTCLVMAGLAGCTGYIDGPPAGDPGPGPAPAPDAGNGQGTLNNNTPDAAIDAGSPCAFQPGTYQEVFTTTDATCNAIAPQNIAIGSTGMIDPGAGCTASSTASCSTTITCSGASGSSTSTSTFVITTGGVSATGTLTVDTVTTAPPGCYATIFCPSGTCQYQGYCYYSSEEQTCTYTVALTKQ